MASSVRRGDQELRFSSPIDFLCAFRHFLLCACSKGTEDSWGVEVDSTHLETWFIFIVLPRKGTKEREMAL